MKGHVFEGVRVPACLYFFETSSTAAEKISTAEPGRGRSFDRRSPTRLKWRGCASRERSPASSPPSSCWAPSGAAGARRPRVCSRASRRRAPTASPTRRCSPTGGRRAKATTGTLAAAAMLQGGSRLRRLRPREIGADRRGLPAGRQQRRLRGLRLRGRHQLPRAVGRAPGRRRGPARAGGRRPGRAGALDPAVRARRRPRLLGDRAAALEPQAGDVPARIPDARSPELRAASVRTLLIYLVLAFALVLFATREGWPARWTALLWLAARASPRC